MTGVAGLTSDPAYPLHQRLPYRRCRWVRAALATRKGDEQTGLACRRPPTSPSPIDYAGRARQVHQSWPLHPRLRARRWVVSTSPIGHTQSRPRRAAHALQVREIVANAQGMASGAITTTRRVSSGFQPAEVVILATNGIGTPRLLLNSASSRFPDGLANSSGLVGKNLMLHPWPQILGYVDVRWTATAGRRRSCGARVLRGRSGLQFRCAATRTAIWTAFRPSKAIASISAGRLPWGADHHRVLPHAVLSPYW